jgi:hypothetical protein
MLILAKLEVAQCPSQITLKIWKYIGYNIKFFIINSAWNRNVCGPRIIQCNPVSITLERFKQCNAHKQKHFIFQNAYFYFSPRDKRFPS